MSEKQANIEPPPHGIASAYYSSNGERYYPVMECLCGFNTGRWENWEETGSELDEHLKGVVLSQVL